MSPPAGRPLISRPIDEVARARGKAQINDALRGFAKPQSDPAEQPRDAQGRFRSALRGEPKSDIAKKADDWIRSGGRRG
jgi:hypothetical protein